jgi:ADP-ribosylglycohydrolase
VESALTLVRATHDNSKSLRAAADFTRILIHLHQNQSIRDTIDQLPLPGVSVKQLVKWEQKEDREIVGGKLSTACYLPESFLASLFLSWKYDCNFKNGVIANAMVGGDNCHRGVVVGAILGIQNDIPSSWLIGLTMMNRLRCDIQLQENPQLLKRAS